jgi:hypothetical protein
MYVDSASLTTLLPILPKDAIFGQKRHVYSVLVKKAAVEELRRRSRICHAEPCASKGKKNVSVYISLVVTGCWCSVDEPLQAMSLGYFGFFCLKGNIQLLLG